MHAKPWEQFAVGKLSSKPRWVNPDCQPLTVVSHVTHLAHAQRVLQDRKVVARLVYDESLLKAERLPVVWLSPNDWTNAGGFRYGNIRFSFEWSHLVNGRQAFWVEHIDYKPQACRILLTNRTIAEMKKYGLQPYDPQGGDGPWWVNPKTGDHYWNGEFCLEILLDGDLPLDDCTELDFVLHHPKRCSIDPSNCPDLDLDADEAGSRFLASTVGNGASLPPAAWSTNKSGARRPTAKVGRACEELLADLQRLFHAPGGELTAGATAAYPVVRALLGRYGVGGPDKRSQQALAALFKNVDELRVASEAVLKADLGFAPKK
jgi:hypothetical protein